ncbi:putative E3 ubiquitin-protein ligase [Elasticomyces elasticus]|nr:putative E3 ubiquitin-protein ligase [Elasticomyces elasticus]
MPSWPPRLLSSNSASSSSNTPHSSSPPSLPHRGKSLPIPTAEAGGATDRPTPSSLHSQPTAPSPPRQLSSKGQQHIHARSVSHPFPALFGRKKSTSQLNSTTIDANAPVDEELVPVLGGPGDPTPTRVISGKRKALDAKDDDSESAKCMCCDSKVRFPRGLKVFRCTSCLTVNDLVPLGEQESRKDGKRSATMPTTDGSATVLPLSVERTKAVIDQCLIAYLRTRAQKQGRTDKAAESSPRTDSPVDDIGELGSNLSAPFDPSFPVFLSASPPDSPSSADHPVLQTEQKAHPKSVQQHKPTPTELYSIPSLVPSSRASQSPIHRKPLPTRPTCKSPLQALGSLSGTSPQNVRPGRILTSPADNPRHLQHSPRLTPEELAERKRYERIKSIFRPLEDYLLRGFGNYECLNASFSTARSAALCRTRSESSIRTPPPEREKEICPGPIDVLSELDAKVLLLGDFAENGTWWTGRVERNRSDRLGGKRKKQDQARKIVNFRTPHINWVELGRWYEVVHSAGLNWKDQMSRLARDADGIDAKDIEALVKDTKIETELDEARQHVGRTLLKISENLLKRPSRTLQHADDVRFLLILLANPSLYPSKTHRNISGDTARPQSGGKRLSSDKWSNMPTPIEQSPKSRNCATEPGQHTRILKRILGLLANSSSECQRYLTNWFSRLSEEQFVPIVDLVASFVTHRLTRQDSRPRSKSQTNDGGLIPDLSGSSRNTSAQLRAAMGLGGSVKQKGNDDNTQGVDYSEDWQLKAAAKVMAMLFAANNTFSIKKPDPTDASMLETAVSSAGLAAHERARSCGQLLPTSSFYNTMLDYHDLIADFKAWESRRAKFTFCQYPFFLSMGSKIKIMEYDARRQMEIKAREAYFDQVTTNRAIDGYFHLRVRRDCMVDDSLRQISAAVGAGQEELKKGLRVHFTGEEGVDAGGLRKEWFLMLVRDIFDPNHGMFVYDPDSHFCYFNPSSFETSDQYYLVGALLGLAIYNSTILDIAFPPFAFRKLLAAAPTSASSTPSAAKAPMMYTLSDLAELHPALASGLRKLLEFDGDVEATFCRDFVATTERYGTVTNVPLIPNGENTPVTNSNRVAFVDAYIRYLLDTAVMRQFEPFKRGFFTVCAGNALSLFRPEEIELLVRGSDEPLDVQSLRAVAVYENWRADVPPFNLLANVADTVPVIGWFWDFFERAEPAKQRKILSFITGSDRIPAVGATSLVLRIVCGGGGSDGKGNLEAEQGRFPVARTCFNMLVLWRYRSKALLEAKLDMAVRESEGFGLK